MLKKLSGLFVLFVLFDLAKSELECDFEADFCGWNRDVLWEIGNAQDKGLVSSKEGKLRVLKNMGRGLFFYRNFRS